MNSEISIQPLTRVEMTITAGKNPASRAAFIFGIGTDGLTGFEMQLAGKKAGETVVIDVKAGTAAELFGHLGCDLLKNLGCLPPFSLKVKIDKISQAGPREVVKAMAAQAECGCDCGCGCF